MVFNETGREIFGLIEREYKGIRFIYKEGVGDLFCFFSSFAKKGAQQSYNYIKKKESFSNPMLWFLDSDTPKSDPRGTYFLGDAKCSYLRNLKQIIEHFFMVIGAQHIYYFGSSKGGTGAILVSLEIGHGTVVVNAPQIHFGSYMANFHPDSVSELGLTVKEIDGFIEEKIKSTSNNVKFVISCGVNDEYHMNAHLLSFMKLLSARKVEYEFWPIPGEHDGDALKYYQRLLDLYAGDSSSYADIRSASDCAQLAFFDRYSTQACLSIFSAIPFYSDVPFENRDDIKKHLIGKTQERLNGKVKSLFFSNDLLVKVPDFPGMQKCVYVVSGGKTYKAERYQSSPEFKFSIPKDQPPVFRVFYKGISDRFAFDGDQRPETNCQCSQIPSEVIFVFITRYSILSKNISRNWLLGQKPFSEYRNELFAPSRMNLHELLFDKVCLPSVRAQCSSNRRYEIRHLVLTSEELPLPNKNFLYELKRRNHHLDILELPSIGTNISTSIAKYLRRKFRSAYLVTVRLDDDDAISSDFCDSLFTYVNNCNVGKVISFGKGIAGIFDNKNVGAFVDFKDYYYPKVAVGLSHINYIDDQGRFLHKRKTIFDQGAHTKVDSFSPLILDSREVKYLRAFHAGSDSISRHYDNVVKMRSIDAGLVPERFSICSSVLVK